MQFLQFFFWIKFELLTSFPSFSWNGLMSGNISFVTWQKMYSVPKETEFNSKDLFNNFNFANVLYSNIFHSVPIHPQTVMRFSVRLRSTYTKWCGLAKWTSSPRWDSPDSYNSKFYSSRHSLLYRAKRWNCLFWYGLEVNQFLSHNRLVIALLLCCMEALFKFH